MRHLRLVILASVLFTSCRGPLFCPSPKKVDRKIQKWSQCDSGLFHLDSIIMTDTLIRWGTRVDTVVQIHPRDTFTLSEGPCDLKVIRGPRQEFSVSLEVASDTIYQTKTLYKSVKCPPYQKTLMDKIKDWIFWAVLVMALGAVVRLVVRYSTQIRI